MRIASVNQDPGIGPERHKGAAVHLEALRGAWRRLGHAVADLDESDDGLLAATLASEDARGLDLVYERHALGRAAAGRFARARGLPHVLEVNAPLADEERVWRGRQVADTARDAALAADREAFENAAAVIAVSRAVAEYAIGRGARRERVHVRPNAVDPELFRPRAADDALRARLVPGQRTAVGFHGRLRPWHGYELVVRAVGLALARGANLHVLSAGEGDFERALAPLEGERVTLLGWQPHERVAEVVRCFDVLALGSTPCAPGAPVPSYYFSPLKLAEAMASGVVPVVPRLGDLERAVEHGVSGLVVAPADPGALADALVELDARPELRRALAQGARVAAERCTWSALAAEVLGLAGLSAARRTGSGAVATKVAADPGGRA